MIEQHVPFKENNHHHHHQPTKPTATFYILEKSKYTEPLPGTTNDLVCESLVEVETDVTEQPLYGKWVFVVVQFFTVEKLGFMMIYKLATLFVGCYGKYATN